MTCFGRRRLRATDQACFLSLCCATLVRMVCVVPNRNLSGGAATLACVDRADLFALVGEYPWVWMGIPIMPTGYRHGYTRGYRWVFMGIDGYFDDLKKAARCWLLAAGSLTCGFHLPATCCQQKNRCGLPATHYLKPAFSNQWSAENRDER